MLLAWLARYSRDTIISIVQTMLGRFADVDVDANSVIPPILLFLAYSVDFVCPFTKSDVYAISHMCICVAIRCASCVYVCVCLSYGEKVVALCCADWMR